MSVFLMFLGKTLGSKIARKLRKSNRIAIINKLSARCHIHNPQVKNFCVQKSVRQLLKNMRGSWKNTCYEWGQEKEEQEERTVNRSTTHQIKWIWHQASKPLKEWQVLPLSDQVLELSDCVLSLSERAIVEVGYPCELDLSRKPECHLNV